MVTEKAITDQMLKAEMAEDPQKLNLLHSVSVKIAQWDNDLKPHKTWKVKKAAPMGKPCAGGIPFKKAD